MSTRIIMVVVLGLLVRTALAQTWTQTSAPETNWISLACSSDANRIAAVTCCEGLVYLSTNSGSTWAPCDAPLTNYQSIRMSADGNTILAPTTQGVIFASTNGGTSWTVKVSPLTSCYSFASSADGVTWFAAGQNGIAVSRDAGGSWALKTNLNFDLVASSADGNRLRGWHSINSFYTSDDAGAFWLNTQTNTRVPLGVALAMACSADGTHLVAAQTPWLTGHQPVFCTICTSTNSGVTWQRMTSGGLPLISVASSADGYRLVAQCLSAGTNAPIYTSTNSGATWIANTVPGGETWSSSIGSVASSADGNRLVAAAYQHGIYTWNTRPSPLITGKNIDGQIHLSWLIPSTPFGLQQTVSLENPIWTGVVFQSHLNFSNLNFEVNLPKDSQALFYRLMLSQ